MSPGFIFIFERPIKVGDRVQTADYFGIVTGIGIRASTIRTFDGAEVVVPNGDLVAKEFVNWTHTDRTRRAEVLVRVALGTDPKEVLSILQRVATEQDKILENPKPSALMTGFGESSLDFRLLVQFYRDLEGGWNSGARYLEDHDGQRICVLRDARDARPHQARPGCGHHCRFRAPSR